MKKISKKIVFILIIICIGFMNVNAQQNGNLSIKNLKILMFYVQGHLEIF